MPGGVRGVEPQGSPPISINTTLVDGNIHINVPEPLSLVLAALGLIGSFAWG